MNNRLKVILISFFSIIMVIFFTLASISNKVETAFGRKYDKNDVINEYKENRMIFLGSINEMIKKNDDICFEKSNNDIFVRVGCHNTKKNIEDLTDDEINQYKNSIIIMKHTIIKGIAKRNENVEFSILSPYGSDQYIVYLINEEKYIFGRNVINKSKVDKNLYYIEAD